MADRGQAGQHSWEGEMLRLLVENVKDYAIFVLDAEGRVQTWSAGAERLLGYRQDEILGQSADRFFTPEDIRADVPRQEMQQALATGRGEDDRWHVRKDGSRFWSSGVMTPLRDEGGTLRGFAKIMRDRTEFKRAEDARNDALAYAQNIVETVREPLIVLDAGLRVRTANRSFYSTFHVAQEETEGRLLYDLGNRQWDIPALRQLLEVILPQNTSFNDFEVAHAFEAIGRKVMVLNARRMYRKGNDTELILLAIEDITERRRVEDERRELETRYTSLVKNVRDHSIFTLDPEGRITSWNREAERILGHSEAEALGQHFSIIFSPEDVAQGIPDSELRTALRSGRAEDERWHLRKNGERFWALGIVTPTQDTRGRHTGFSKILRDMTDRKRAEEALRRQAEALRRSEERLRRMVNIEGVGVLIFDETGTLLDANDTFQHMFGYSREEVAAKQLTWRTMTPPEYVEESERQMRGLAETGRIGPYEKEYLRKDGSRSWMVFAGATLGDGTLIEYCIDVSDRKRAEEALREADRRKDEFLAMLAHELRNPLAPIRTGLDRMRLKAPPDSPLHPVLDVVERQLGQLTRLVGDLLDVSRITRGQITLQKERVDLHAVISQAVETARPLIDAGQHHLTYTPSPEPLPVEADRTRLAQALSNVLSNAAQYTEPGGRIWLTAEREEGQAVVRVRDTGIGIAPNMLGKVFDLFTQGHQARGRSQGGLGVGLAVAKRLIEMHGGSVTASSPGEGQGSEFVVRLPLLLEHEGAESEGVRAGEGRPTDQAPRRRILLVDDLVEVAEDLASLLREAFGHDVRTAYDGPTALQLACGFQPELVLLDIGLPGMSGYEVARRLRELPGLGDAVLVAVTGWGREEDHRQTQEAGFNHHLVKPVGLKELRSLLAGLK